MSAEVETMAYAGTTPWHGLGEKVANNLSPAQMLKTAGLDWKVSKQPLFVKPNGSEVYLPVKDRFGLVRDTDNSTLTIVSNTYKPVQNDVAMDFFKKFVVAGKMTMETAGSLWNGRYIWALAKIGTDFKLGKNDEVRGYLLLMQPHVRGKAMVIQFTPIRVVCWNTLNFALGSDLRGKAGAFRMVHTMEFSDAVKASAAAALGLATNQMEEFKEAATLLSKAKVKPEVVEEFFFRVLKFDPKKADKKKDGELKVPRMLPKFQEALTHAPGQELPGAAGTLWGALNAVTYVVDHEAGRDRSTALKSAWVGSNAVLKRRALDTALEMAK